MNIYLLSWPRAEYLSSALSILSRFRYHTTMIVLQYCSTSYILFTFTTAQFGYNTNTGKKVVILSDLQRKGQLRPWPLASSFGKDGCVTLLVLVKLPYVQRSLTKSALFAGRCSRGTFGQSRSLVLKLPPLMMHDAWVFCPKKEALAHRRLNNDRL